MTCACGPSLAIVISADPGCNLCFAIRFFFLTFLFHIGVKLINSVGLVSSVQQCDSVMNICVLFFKFFSHLDYYRALS